MLGGESESSSRTESSGSSVMISLDVGSLVSFDTKGDPHGLSQRWRKWKRLLKLYLTGKGVTNDAQKQALFYTGQQGGDNYFRGHDESTR